jgi:chromosome segregation ATPase
MAEFDQAVVNLERFIGLVVNATSAVGQVEDHVVECARRLGELEQDASEEGGGLNDRLEELAAALEMEETETVAAMGELRQVGAEAQMNVAGLYTTVEQAAIDLEQAAAKVETELEQAGTQLDDGGFEPFVQGLETARQELEASGQEAEQALTELVGAASGFETEAETAWDDAGSELDSSTSALVAAETAIEAVAQEGVQGFDAAADSLEAACGTLVTEVDQIYDALDSGVAAQGQQWEQAVDAAAQDALAFVGEARGQRLEPSASVVDDEALGPLSQEYESLGTVLDASAAPLADLEPLSDELVRAQSVVVQIDELMTALA